ncbi:MAG: glycosyltransferase family 4 protein [bacterium]
MKTHWQRMLYRLPVEWREHRRWKVCPPTGTPPRVFYGFDRLPAPHEPGHGGIIKVQDLQQMFPNSPHRANLLYLISSYTPLFASRMAERARRAGAHFILNQNGVAYPGWYGPGWENANTDMRKLLVQADHIVYQSRFCKDNADRYLGEAHCPSDILHNPVDTRVFVPAPTDPAPGRFVILLAGSHGSFYRVQTAVDTLAELLPHLPESQLIIAGRCAWRSDTATAEAELQAYASKRGVADRVELTGPYPQTAAVPLMQRAHVLLHTKYNDPCPRLVVEAMACGLPIVYSATGGMPELVTQDAGVGIPGPIDYEQDHPPSPAALAEALLTVARQQATFAAAARLHAMAHLDIQPWLCRHAEIFNNLATRAS